MAEAASEEADFAAEVLVAEDFDQEDPGVAVVHSAAEALEEVPTPMVEQGHDEQRQVPEEPAPIAVQIIGPIIIGEDVIDLMDIGIDPIIGDIIIHPGIDPRYMQ